MVHGVMVMHEKLTAKGPVVQFLASLYSLHALPVSTDAQRQTGSCTHHVPHLSLDAICVMFKTQVTCTIRAPLKNNVI